MIELKENFSLEKHNTLKLKVKTKFFIEVFSVQDLLDAIAFAKEKNLEILTIGDGANILFTKDYDGLVIRNSIKGIKIVEENDDYIILEIGGGENWPDLVTYAVENNWAGIENLAYIPGTVGAAPIQNIAAYGQELADTFISLSALDIETKEIKNFNKDDCDFKYRYSVFKGKLKNKYYVLSIRLKLEKNAKELNTSYYSRFESIKDDLKAIAQEPYTLKDIYNAVINLRKRKLPDPKEIGTIGSTFANPFLNQIELKKLQKIVPEVQFYPVNNMMYIPLDDERLKNAEIVKIPAGWLFDEAGWKGLREGNVGTFKNHALCAIAYEGATCEEFFNFTEKMRKDFKEKYNIDLEYEVNVI